MVYLILILLGKKIIFNYELKTFLLKFKIISFYSVTLNVIVFVELENNIFNNL